MSELLRALLGESIDYAGMFPPARLSLDAALQNYGRYLQAPEAWLLARFVCPASKLDELGACAKSLHLRIPHGVAVVATACEDAQQCLESLHLDVANIARFHQRHGDYAKVDSLELKLPYLSGGLEPIVELLKSVRRQAETARLRPLPVLIEMRPNEDPRQLLSFLAAIGSIRDEQLGMKIRTGGLPSDQWPSVDRVAHFIDACRVAGRRWKATAGLHQPFSHFDSAENTWRFGFVNVLAAAVSAWTGRTTLDQIREILTERRPDEFLFTDSMFACRGLELTAEDVRRGRTCSMMSFGTCSFEEPGSGLRDAALIA